MKTHLYLHAAALCLAAVMSLLANLAAQSTAFTYQGRLTHGESAANGAYEMSFTLYDAATTGNVVGTPMTVAPVPVSNGLFTAALDFGASAFVGANQKETEITELKQMVNKLKRRDTENAELKARLTTLEKLVSNLSSKGN